MKDLPSEKPVIADRSRRPVEAIDVPAARPRPFRRDYRSCGIAAMVVIAVAVLLAPVGYSAYVWYTVLRPPGEVAYDDWPLPLKARCAEWKEAGVDVDGMKVYVAADFIDRDCYCRVRYSPKSWAYFKARYETKGDEASPREFWRRVRWELPEWAPNLDSPDVEFLPIEPYREGERINLACDPSGQTIYINYVFIF